VIVVQELVRQFVGHGHRVEVFYFDDRNELVFDCPVRRIKHNEPIDFSQFDIVHSHSMRPDRYVTRFARRNGRTRYLTTQHSYMMPDLTYEYNRVVAMLAGNWWLMRWTRRHDRIITLSRHAMDYYRRWFPSERLTYAYNTRSIDPSKVSLSREEERMIARFRGRSTLIGINALLTARKGVDLMIRALRHLPGHKLFVAGDGKDRKRLEALARFEGVEDRCLFAGYRKDAYRFLPLYDVYALPSRSEGFPIALLEAASFAMPTVCSSLPVIREIWNEGEVAFFELDDIDSLKKAILRATGNRKMGEALRRRYDEQYSPDRFYRRHLEIYSDELRR
jgi:glycosyltransferase involved in cell wall biosynthesis